MKPHTLPKYCAVALLCTAFATRALALNVGIVPTSDGAAGANVQSDMIATGLFGTVDLLTGLESQAILSTYDSILVYQNTAADHSAVGNNLATYVDNGGGLVAATFIYQNYAFYTGGWGALETGGYLPFENYTGNYNTNTLGLYNASHAIMAGPLSISAISGSYRDLVSLSADAELVASWSDGSPFVAVDGGSGVVGITLFPNDLYGNLGGDYNALFANALYFAGNGEVTPDVPDSGATLSLLALGFVGLVALRRRV